MAVRKFLFLDGTEGFHTEQAAADELSLGKVTATGVSGVAFDASSQKIVNVGTPTVGTDAANKDYVDAYALGLDWKQSVRVVSTSNLVATRTSNTLTADANGSINTAGIDGVTTLALGNRVLVSGQSTAADNGIYTITDLGSAGTPWVMLRATDADTSAEVTAGLACFIEEGTSYADTGWVLTTNNPITLNTTGLAFSQFTGLASIIAGAGLSKTGSQLDVELDTAADAQSAGSGGGSSGLEFDTSGAAGKLRARVSATGGINRMADGLGIEIDDTPDTLDVGAAGLKVVGLPSLFKVNGTAVGATVTAANLDTLTNGSDASSLHYHPKHKQVWTASGAIVKGDGVYISGNNVVSTGDSSVDAESRIIGVADAAIADTNSGDIVINGTVTGVLSGATAGAPYYMTTTGQPVVYGSLASNNRVIRMGFAKNATDLEVRIFDFGKKA